MAHRIDYYLASPDAMNALLAVEVALSRCALEPRLLQLVKLRASQINQCAFCVDMENAEARRAGESPRRLDALALWQHSELFTGRERAALAWTEVLTRMDREHDDSRALDALRVQFSEEQIGDLSLAIAAINCWNRMGVGFRRTLSSL